MSFEAIMSLCVLAMAAALLAFFLLKGVALPFGTVVKGATQPLRFAAYCGLYLVPILFQAFLFHREHPIARDSFWLLIGGLNIAAILRRTQAEPNSSLSRHEFASVEKPFTPQRAALIIWGLLISAFLAIILLNAARGKYAVPL